LQVPNPKRDLPLGILVCWLCSCHHCYYTLLVLHASLQVRNPKRDLPLGILGALGVVTVCYMLMAAVLVMMVPLAALDKGASFAAAFAYVNMDWARYIVALGALMGIITTTLVRNQLSQHRQRQQQQRRLQQQQQRRRQQQVRSWASSQ
jgi:hypothetical protein